eukprot:CAMPEP_0116013322 /NCGR_PEP_ID=MMETSP0321-20121206/5661_1 /TAXON_ID=163516 /ORGANISM="Leptocylindrus danicus var. danicus, Strain B650" /LENGTH=1067 /DNA_ID=CAMNT_0003482857 /DNA_START=864 /DNA_END=4067 /DNA_ORIENTATION=+
MATVALTKIKFNKELRPDKSFLEEVWNVVSSKQMKSSHKLFLNGSYPLSERGTVPLELALDASKLMGSVVFSMVLKISASTNNIPDSSIDCLSFSASCVLSCLFEVADILDQVNRYEALNFAGTSPSLSRKLILPNAVECTRVISRIACLAAKVFLRAREVLASENFSDKRFFGRSISSMVLTGIKTTLSAIVQSIDTGSAGDAAFSSCIGLIRATIQVELIGFGDLCTKTQSKVDGEQLEIPKHTDPAQDNEYGAIDDEAFLDIDLDGLIAQHHGADANHNVDSDSLWDFFLLILKQSKPSTRFAVKDFTSSQNKQLSSSGMALVHRQAEKICTVLAFLSSIRPQEKLLFFYGEQCRLGLAQDFPYLRSLGQCFSVELCSLANTYGLCDKHVHSNIEGVFSYFLEAILDSSILALFPSSNFDLLFIKNGCIKSARKRVMNASRRAEEWSQKVQDFDVDAYGITYRISRLSPEEFGTSFLARHLWTFGNNLSKCLERNHQNTYCALQISRILRIVDPIMLNAEHNDEIMSALGVTPRASLERECLKRLLVVTAFFKLLDDSQLESNSIMVKGASVAIHFMLEHLQFVSDTVEYHERVTTERGGRRSGNRRSGNPAAYALQRAYSEMSVACLSVFLKVYKPNTRTKLCKYAAFVKNSLMAPSLDYNLRLKVAMQTSASRTSDPEFHINFHAMTPILGGRGDDGGSPLSLTDDIRRATLHRLNDVFASFANPSEAILFLEAGVMVPSTSLAIGCFLSCSHPQQDPKRSSLQEAIDVFLGPLLVESNQMAQLRCYTFESFLLRKLYFSGLKQNVVVGAMNMLLGMLSISWDMRSKEDFQIGLERGKYFCVADVVKIAKATISCLRDTICGATVNECIVELSFKIAHYLFRLSILIPAGSNGRMGSCSYKLLEWAQYQSFIVDGGQVDSFSARQLSGSFIWKYALWMNEIGFGMTDSSKCQTCLSYIKSLGKGGTLFTQNTASGLNTNEEVSQLTDALCEIEAGLTKKNILSSQGVTVPAVKNRYRKMAPERQDTLEGKQSWTMKNRSAVIALKGIKAQIIEVQVLNRPSA